MTLRNKLITIIAIVGICVVIDMPKNIHLFGQTITRPELRVSLFGKTFYRDLEIRQGLDLKGGTQVLLRANTDGLDPSDHSDALESSREIISRRIDLYGINEANIQTSKINDENRIIVELPGVTNINQALDLIGATAQLDFRELAPDKIGTTAALLTDFTKTELTGKNLKRSRVEFDQSSGQPVVSLEFDDEGARLFEEITANNIGQPVGIFLDDLPIVAPHVSEPITNGMAVISGGFDTETAKNLSIQLNAGALPVPIEIVSQQNIGASLGSQSVNRSIIAGVVGLSAVMLFMIIYYGFKGLVANIALLIYGLITLALYKLLPVTLTLPGLAGFILSVGMAVDSNILIFERMKEELRAGKKIEVALELGFGRAWDSIKDANIATLITAFILFNPLNWSFLNSSGMIRGFALTLAIGIAVSLFTGIFVTRTLMRIVYRSYKGER